MIKLQSERQNENMILIVMKTSPGNYRADVVPEVLFKDRCKELRSKGHSMIWTCKLDTVNLIESENDRV